MRVFFSATCMLCVCLPLIRFILFSLFRCKIQLFAIQAVEYGLLAILMALISSSADDFQFNDLAVEHMRVCLSAPNALEGLIGQENTAHPKGSAVLQVFCCLHFMFWHMLRFSLTNSALGTWCGFEYVSPFPRRYS